MEENQIYKFMFLPTNLMKTYSDILEGYTVDQIQQAFSSYIVQNIEPVGWKGLWIPFGNSNNRFVVDVVDVLDSLVAVVRIIEIIDNESPEFFEHIEFGEERTVPLIELFVISKDDHEKVFQDTAYLIEVVRFFYRNIWKAWDHYSENVDFIQTLNHRLEFIFDIKDNKVSSKLCKRYETITNESELLSKQLTQIVFCESPMVSSKMGFNEYTRTKFKLQSYQREAEIIEDSLLRDSYDILFPNQIEEINCPSLHIVSNEILNLTSLSNNLNILNNLLKDDNSSITKWPIKLHQSFSRALYCSEPGDCIYLTEGTYDPPSLCIRNDIEIIGIDPEKVELVSTNQSRSDDELLLIKVPNTIKIRNIKFKSDQQLNHLIVLNSGHLFLENCVLDCRDKYMEEPVLVLNQSQLTQEDTKTLKLEKDII